ncbi:hypothetical protein FOZ62_000216 [Perkinsus olseni]|uniref:Clathrin light chain n=1 Tax=Perkinsus olseni TaxID=32597 RepID=A0A7J6UGY4_PEROL|nr:hypothetical protein FOZ62_000216 [Perkinsus olseni]
MSDDLLQFTAPSPAAPTQQPLPTASSPSSTPVLSSSSPTAAAPPPPPPEAYDTTSSTAAVGVKDEVVDTTEMNGLDKERSSSVDSYMEMSRSEEEKKAALRAKAQEDIKSFYAGRAEKIEENKGAQLEAEKEFVDRVNQLDNSAAASNPWTVVANHINFYKDPINGVAGATVSGSSSSNGSNKASTERTAAHKEREVQKEGGNQTRMKQLLQGLRKNGMDATNHAKTVANVGA